METIAFIIALGVGLAIGMYISSQIIHSIDKNINRKKFHRNMSRLDKKKK